MPELFGEFNAFKQETAQILQHILGNGGNHQQDRDFIYSDGSTKTINSGLINSDRICYAKAHLQVIASLLFLPTCLRTSPDSRMQHYGLYYAFATVISSLVGGSQIPIHPIDLMTKFHQRNPFLMENHLCNVDVVFLYCFYSHIIVILLLVYYTICLHDFLME
jgi:hypothetical protein